MQNRSVFICLKKSITYRQNSRNHCFWQGLFWACGEAFASLHRRAVRSNHAVCAALNCTVTASIPHATLKEISVH
jgi:hypothetical protein